MRVLFALIVTVAVSAALDLEEGYGGYVESLNPKFHEKMKRETLADVWKRVQLQERERTKQEEEAKKQAQTNAQQQQNLVQAEIDAARTRGQLTEEQKLQQNIDTLESQMETLNQALSGERQKSSGLLNRIADINMELERVKAEKTEALQDNSRMSLRIMQLSSETTKLNNEVQQLQSRLQYHEDSASVKDEQRQEEVLIIKQLFEEEKQRDKEEYEKLLHQNGWSILGEEEDESFEVVEVDVGSGEDSGEGSGDDNGSGDEEVGETSGDDEGSGEESMPVRRRSLMGSLGEAGVKLSIGRRQVTRRQAPKKRALLGLLRGDKISLLE